MLKEAPWFNNSCFLVKSCYALRRMHCARLKQHCKVYQYDLFSLYKLLTLTSLSFQVGWFAVGASGTCGKAATTAHHLSFCQLNIPVMFISNILLKPFCRVHCLCHFGFPFQQQFPSLSFSRSFNWVFYLLPHPQLYKSTYLFYNMHYQNN